MQNVEFYKIIISMLLGALTLFSGLAFFWIKHYIKTNDRQHSKLFELINEIKNHLIKRGY